MQPKRVYLPRLIAWEVTRSCPYQCKHCRAGAVNKTYENEFSFEEVTKTLDNIASFCSPIIIITGGEPMMRDDVYDIARYGTKIGLRMVMAPCGEYLNETTIKKIKDSGISRISLSIDGATSESHDRFRQTDGAFSKIMTAAKLSAELGLEFQVNTTIHSGNIDEIFDIMELSHQIGAKAFHPFLLVPTGRASKLRDNSLDQDKYESVLEKILKRIEQYDFLIKPTCAPQYHRIQLQDQKAGGAPQAADAGPQGNPGAHPHGHGRLQGKPGGHPHAHRMSEGCMGGKSFAFISHTGKIQICGFLDIEAGDLRTNDYDFRRIWDSSPFLGEIRDIDSYYGKCGACEYKKVCSGCRARAYTMNNHYLEDEPYCSYQPKLQKV